MSSSNRLVNRSDATIFREQVAVGPVRLPKKDQNAFIDRFNQLYRSHGIELITDPKQEPPDSESDQRIEAGDFANASRLPGGT